ncbi:hypothetical protein HYH03_013583 [Edaphochlamys debaryana]|uniref:Fumarylacetoacetase n=1 Tax=Edaphochlamys debaryana TaxID=47281 RepID=A0A836BT25_9CHLO|nr:hypothetical protein HYH03_013583 [Edaphochlamys debaryana]|eukprot:KAG2487870.1 hypothetical protein HYH03_013583 [Edaphochlamys debaryana]
MTTAIDKSFHLPVAYHGRSSAIVPSGVDVRRPCPWLARTRSARLAPPQPAAAPAAEADRGSAPPPAGSAAACPAAAAPPAPVFVPSAAVDFELELASHIFPWVVALDALDPFKTRPPPQTEAEALPYCCAAAENWYPRMSEAVLTSYNTYLRGPDPYTYGLRLP